MKRLLVALSVICLVTPLSAREGFGFKKKAVDMTRTIPPATNVGARRVKVEVSGDRRDVEDDARTLERYLTEAILAGDGTLAEAGRPEVTLIVTLDRLESHETWDTDTEYERRQTGTKQKWNEKKQKYETEPIYSSVAVQKQYKVLDASLLGTFEIADRSNRDVASSSLDEKFHKKYGDYETAPSPTSIEDDLLKAAARKIAAHLVPTTERVSVLLPRSTFEPMIAFAESGSWDRYLAAVEAVPARKSAKDEAYRQYALAVGKEALAYTNDDRAEALSQLREALSHYEVAISSNPSEELFRKGYTSLLSVSDIGAPLERATDSVNRYSNWTTEAPATARVASAPAPSAAKSGMRNETVIELVKAGVSDDNIVLAINSAAATQFDVSPTGLSALSKAGVSKSVIAAMKKK
jgi:hypothetical protein